MDRLSTGQKIGVGGAALLLVSSFLPWYSISFGPLGSANLKGWNSGFFAWMGISLGLAAGAVLLLKALGTKDVRGGGLAAEQIALLLGAASVVLIVLRLITQMDLVAFGLFLGLVGAALTAYGSFMAMKEAGLSVDDMKRNMGGSGTDTPGGPPPPPTA